ncbi:MAG: BON domain-containing protein [Planctomycetota bacterium]
MPRTLVILAALFLVPLATQPGYGQGGAGFQQQQGFGQGQPGGFGTGGRGAGARNAGPQERAGPRAGDTQNLAQQQGFVGRNANDVRQNFRNMGGRQRRDMMFDFVVENLNEMRDRRNRRRNRRNQPPPVRVRLNPSFEVAPSPESLPATTAAPRLASALKLKDIGDARVEVNGRVATLYGTADSPESKRLIEKLVSLEPGIDRIENLLEVAPSSE